MKNTNGKKEIAVTGLGAITPIGLNVKAFWNNYCQKKSGIKVNNRFDSTNFRSRVAGLIDDFNPQDHFAPNVVRRIDKVMQFGAVAASEALTQSGLLGYPDEKWKSNAAVFMGTGSGGMITLSDEMEKLRTCLPRQVNPMLMPMMLVNSTGGFIGIQFGLKGPNSCISTACASGASAVATACHYISSGMSDVVIAGGTEASIVPIIVAAFDSLKALTFDWNDKPEYASRPYCLKRSGFVIAEGAGAVVLEEYEFAKSRGAVILAKISGWGETCDAHNMVVPNENGAGLASAMQKALTMAGLSPETITHINAHATSTPLGDRVDSEAMKTVFKENRKNIIVSALKSSIGHTLGASGALALITSICMIQNKFIPPALNSSEMDPECDVALSGESGIEGEIHHSLVNASGFGGHNVSIVASRPD
jgi:3-oxoacyl-[acyl-carrier-protein] synthase II